MDIGRSLKGITKQNVTDVQNNTLPGKNTILICLIMYVYLCNFAFLNYQAAQKAGPKPWVRYMRAGPNPAVKNASSTRGAGGLASFLLLAQMAVKESVRLALRK